MHTLRVKSFAILVLWTAVLIAPSVVQASDLIPASKSITEQYGVASYQLSESEDEESFTIAALTDDGQTVFTASWTGTPDSGDISVTLLSGSSRLDTICSTVDGSPDCIAFENSRPRAVQDLSDVSRGLAAELNAYLGDIVGQVASQCSAEGAMANVGKRFRLPFAGLTGKGPNNQQQRVMNGICYIAGICTGFWPIGTLICGPTAVGCTVYYFTCS